MTIHFHIEYGTMFGEQLVLNIQEDDEEELKIPMATLNGRHEVDEVEHHQSV